MKCFCVGVIALLMVVMVAVPPSAAAQGDICPEMEAAILEARTPEVDLFDAPSGGDKVMSIARDEFPTFLPILAQTEARMLKVEIEGTKFWIAPHMVQFRAGHEDAPICRVLAEGGDDTRTGTTRGLGEGC